MTSVSEKTQLLSGVALFQDLSPEELDEVAALTRTEVYEDGDVIVREGETADRLLVVRSGTADVFIAKGQMEAYLFTVGPGGHFGEAALVTEFTRTATVRASGPALIFALPQHAFRSLIERRPTIGQRVMIQIIRELLERLQNTSRELATMMTEGDRVSAEDLALLFK